MSTLSRATPESVGIASKDVLGFVDAVEAAELELHSLMLLRYGSVVAEGWWSPYQKDDIHLLYSLSKSFTSTAIGFTIQEGLVQLDDPIISFFPDKLPNNPSDKLQVLKVRHLLSMSTGHAVDNMDDMRFREDGDWVRGFLARDIEFEPGTHFLYNNGASYTLSAIVSKVTGMSALDYLRPRLFDPLGIEKATWTACPNGISIGASELRITTESIAKFGQLYLQRGLWNGQRILSEEWIEEATKFQVSNASNDQPDWQVGYGFQFWRSRHNCYRGDGAFGQFCIVSPELEMVIAMTASVSSMQAVLDLVWNHLLPAAKPNPFPENPDTQAALTAKLGSLVLPSPNGKASSPTGRLVSGRLYKSSSDENKIRTCTFDFDPNCCTLTIRNDKGDRSLRVGTSHWIQGIWVMGSEISAKVAAVGRWTDPGTYEIKIRGTESPSGATIVSRFDGNTLNLETTLTGRFGPTEGPKFDGIASPLPFGS